MRGPGLRKASLPRLLSSHQFELWRVVDYELGELFEHADVMSEGAARAEGPSLTYYGITSILLLTRSHGGNIPDESLHNTVEVLRRNPHARTRAIRIACREAQVRCPQPLARVEAELLVRVGPKGVHIDVEVEAPVLDHDRVVAVTDSAVRSRAR